MTEEKTLITLLQVERDSMIEHLRKKRPYPEDLMNAIGEVFLLGAGTGLRIALSLIASAETPQARAEVLAKIIEDMRKFTDDIATKKRDAK